ncbi:MAG: hypothetical protein ACLGIR_10375 [Actinomycetes bacterium]
MSRLLRDLVAALPRGLRALAAGVVALVVAAATAALVDAPAALATLGAVLLAVGWVVDARRRRATGDRAGDVLAAGGVVTGALLLVVAVPALLDLGREDLGPVLATGGAVLLGLGLLRDERRLVSLGLLQWVAWTGRPLPGGPRFRHCLVAPEVALPTPRLTGPLVVGAVALVVGALLGRAGGRLATRRDAARGAELTGLVVVLVVLLARAVELPGLAELCGPGGGAAVDAGWVVALLAVATAGAVAGLAARDLVVVSVCGTALAVTGLVATGLSGQARWAVAALVPLGGTLAAGARAGLGWPRPRPPADPDDPDPSP